MGSKPPKPRFMMRLRVHILLLACFAFALATALPHANPVDKHAVGKTNKAVEKVPAEKKPAITKPAPTPTPTKITKPMPSAKAKTWQLVGYIVMGVLGVCIL